MLIWVLKIGEPLPTDGLNVRLHRTGLLCNQLRKMGHEVVWWTSTFSHQAKAHRFSQDCSIVTETGTQVRLLHANGYKRNVSFARILNHREIARKFKVQSREFQAPDIILCAFPAIELCAECVGYAIDNHVPVIVDIRDLWPDIFLEVVPAKLRFLVRPFLWKYFAMTKFALAKATALIAMSEGCLSWGLRYAGRDRRPDDGVFRLGYQEPLSEAQTSETATVLSQLVGVDSRKFICWFVGMFGRHYDVLTIIQAARQLSVEDNSFQFVISGDGERNEEWRLAAKGLPNVVFTGWIHRDQISYLMRIARIGILAYDGVPESVPNKLFEYMAAGLAIVSCLRGEAAELLESHNCGLMYRARDPYSLVIALKTLRNDESLQKQMGKNARVAFERYYSADKIYSELEQHLSRIADH